MKQFFICLLMGLLLVNCSSSSDEIIPEEMTGPEPVEFSIPIFSADSTLVADSLTQGYEMKSRSWNSNIVTNPTIYIVSDVYGEKYSLPVSVLPNIISPNNYFIVFTLSVKNGTVYASNSGQSIPLTDDCVLSTVPQGIANSLVNGGVTTPSGHPADEPYGDQLFKTAPFKVGFFNGALTGKYYYDITYDGRKYDNQSLLGKFETSILSGKIGLTFKMYRETTRIKANVVIINKEEYEDGETEGELSSKDFKKKMGTEISDWEVRTYITGAPATYNQLASRRESGDKIVALMESPVTFREKQEVKFGNDKYEGIGKVFEGKDGFVHVFPMQDEDAKLCYSFYYKKADKRSSKYREYNTLEVPLTGVDLAPNVENEITTVFYLSDFKTSMLKPTKSRVSDGCKESRYFGVVMDIPYEIRVSHK